MSDAQIPDKPALEGLEQKWDAAWSAAGTYLFDRDAAKAKGRAGVFSVDTPRPPRRVRCTSATSSATPTPT